MCPCGMGGGRTSYDSMTDASRLWIVGGAAVLAAALWGGAFYGLQDRAAAPPAPAPTRAEGGARPTSLPPAGEARPARLPEPPRFDVVRMGARGTVVVAGRAAPGADVVLREGGREIGRARADSRGEWVILPAEPLGSGARELSLAARLPGGEEMMGADTVLVVGPAPAGPEVAGATPDGVAREEGRAEGPLVLLLPPTAAGAPRLLGRSDGPALPLGLDVVDYDEAGAMRFAGNAPPGVRLRIYADNRHLGDAQADPAGRWSLIPSAGLARGRHMLRVDQLDPVGPRAVRVASRIEVPFQREILPPGTVRDGRLVVQPGANLWRIAREAYGQGTRYTVIYRANREQIRNPARIYPGQVLAVP